MCARFCTSRCEIESCRHVFPKCGPYLVQVMFVAQPDDVFSCVRYSSCSYMPTAGSVSCPS